MTRTATGVAADDVLITTIQLTPRSVNAPANASRVDGWRLVADVHTRLLDAIRQQPGVVAAGSTNFLPLTVGWRNPFNLDGQAMPARIEDLPQVQMHSVSDGYFEAMGATVVTGRAFTGIDTADAPGVVLVNDTFAARYLGEGTAGRRVRTWASQIGPLGLNLKSSPAQQHEGVPFEVVGVVRDVKNSPLGQDVEPAIYFSTRQFPFSELFVAVRASDVRTAQAAVREALRAVVPAVPMGASRTWGDRMAAYTAEARLLMSVLLGFGALAGLLAALGVYGLFAWAVTLRTRELAIRLTLGATPRSVGASVMRQSARLVAGGLLVGVVLVQASDALLARVLYGIRSSDPAAIGGAVVVLLVAALGACVPAAWRAMRVDPAVGLRAE
jgi:putative ABC transport system permease protein